MNAMKCIKPCGKCLSENVCKYRNVLFDLSDILSISYEANKISVEQEIREFLYDVSLDIICPHQNER